MLKNELSHPLVCATSLAYQAGLHHAQGHVVRPRWTARTDRLPGLSYHVSNVESFIPPLSAERYRQWKCPSSRIAWHRI